jgi:putative heme-binding domain-containing protein
MEQIPTVLAELSRGNDRWLRAAVLSSAQGRAGRILTALVDQSRARWNSNDFVTGLIATATEGGSPDEWADVLRLLAPQKQGTATVEELEPWRLDATASLLESLRRGGRDLQSMTAKMGTNEQAAVRRIDELLQGAAVLATNSGAPSPARLAAIRLLAVWDQDVGVKTLTRLLASPEAEWHEPAVAALARSRRPEIGAQLLTAWKGLGPAVRARVMDVLLNRPAWTPALMTAIEKGEVRTSEVSAVQRQRLLNPKNDKAVRERAAKVFPASNVSNRVEVFKRFESVASLKGAPANGAAVFDKSCAQCHAMRGHGHDVGPNLAEFAGKPPQDFLLAILDPNAGINPNFIGYNLELKDGRSLSGLIRHETASGLTLVQAGGVRETIPRQDLLEMRAADLSMMPEGLEHGLTPQEMADLIAWLKGARPRLFGSSTAEQATKARAAFLQDRPARAIAVTRAVERLPYPGWLGRWPLAYCRQNAGQDLLSWNARPADGATSNRLLFRFPAAMGFASQPRGEFSLQINETRCLSFDVGLNDSEWRSADGQVALRYSVAEASEEDSCGVIEIEVAPSLATSDGVTRFAVTGSASNSQRWFGLYLIE